MDGETRFIVLAAIVAAMVAFGVVQLWPYRRFREFVFRRRIAAPSERIWDSFVDDVDNPLSAAFNDTVVSTRTVSNEPKVIEVVADASGRHRTHFTVTHAEVLVADRPNRYASRALQVDNQPLPYGRDSRMELQLDRDRDCVSATLTWRGETGTLAQNWMIRRLLKRYMDALKTFCETGQGHAQPLEQRSRWKSIAMTLLATASFAFLFGWAFAFVFVIAIFIHEYGHWLAMRMTGQPKPRVMLVPFLGGVAIPNHPHKTEVAHAFVALAGPGLSLVPCIALLWGATALGVPDFPKTAKAAVSNAPMSHGLALLTITYVVALINGMQLLPVLPLDGGQVVRCIVESTSARRVRPILLALATAGIVGAILTGYHILALFLVFGAVQSWQFGNFRSTARPMGRVGLAATIASYVAIIAVYAGIVIYAKQTI